MSGEGETFIEWIGLFLSPALCVSGQREWGVNGTLESSGDAGGGGGQVFLSSLLFSPLCSSSDTAKWSWRGSVQWKKRKREKREREREKKVKGGSNF